MPDTLAHIAAGRMDQRVRFQRPVTVRDTTGAPRDGFQDAFPAWAEITPQTGREPVVAQRLEHEITHEIRCRARPSMGVTAQWRIVKDAPGLPGVLRIFDIDHILDSFEHGAVWILRCVERPQTPADVLTTLLGGPTNPGDAS